MTHCIRRTITAGAICALALFSFASGTKADDCVGLIDEVIKAYEERAALWDSPLRDGDTCDWTKWWLLLVDADKKVLAIEQRMDELGGCMNKSTLAAGTLESDFKDVEETRDFCCMDEIMDVYAKSIDESEKIMRDARAIVGITANPDLLSGATWDEVKAANPWDKAKSPQIAKKLCMFGLSVAIPDSQRFVSQMESFRGSSCFDEAKRASAEETLAGIKRSIRIACNKANIHFQD